jgi:hypothetical protein
MSEVTPISPNACRWCDVEESNHYQRWTQEAGWHMFTSPPDELRLERMRARREKQA